MVESLELTEYPAYLLELLKNVVRSEKGIENPDLSDIVVWVWDQWIELYNLRVIVETLYELRDDEEFMQLDDKDKVYILFEEICNAFSVISH